MFDVHLFSVKRVKGKWLDFSPGATKSDAAAAFARADPVAESTAGAISGEAPRAAPEHPLGLLVIRPVGSPLPDVSGHVVATDRPGAVGVTRKI
jgi:hypothetical protein